MPAHLQVILVTLLGQYHPETQILTTFGHVLTDWKVGLEEYYP